MTKTELIDKIRELSASIDEVHNYLADAIREIKSSIDILSDIPDEPNEIDNDVTEETNQSTETKENNQ